MTEKELNEICIHYSVYIQIKGMRKAFTYTIIVHVLFLQKKILETVDKKNYQIYCTIRTNLYF